MKLNSFEVNCRRCGKKVKFVDSVHDKSIKGGICSSCSKKNGVSGSEISPNSEKKKVKFRCANCGYSFRKKVGDGKGCPYCNKDKISRI